MVNKKICSLRIDDEEVLSVEVEATEGLPTPRLDKSWLRGLIAEGIRNRKRIATVRRNGRGEGNRTPKAVRV